MAVDVDVWKVRLFSSVSNLSRTSAGAANKAYTGKPSLLITDPALLRRQTAQNLRLAVSYVWSRGPSVKADAEAVRTFVDIISARISEGLLPPDRRSRSWELDKEKYPRGISPEELPSWLDTFYQSVAMIHANDGIDPVRNAAWIERIYDGMLHPLADGCGRVAKLLGAWTLLRSGKYPAHFESRAEYYAAMESSPEVWEKFYRTHVPL